MVQTRSQARAAVAAAAEALQRPTKEANHEPATWTQLTSCEQPDRAQQSPSSVDGLQVTAHHDQTPQDQDFMEVGDDGNIPMLEYRVDDASTYDEEVVNLVNSFWQETEALADRHLHLTMQHSRLAAAQNAAIMEVKYSTETEVQQLAQNQSLTAVQFREELDRTRTAMQAHLIELAQMQQHQGQQIHQSLGAQIQQAFANVHAQASRAAALATAQADESRNLRALMESTIDDMRTEFSRRLDALPAPVLGETVHSELMTEMRRLVIQSVDEKFRVATPTMSHDETDALIELKMQRALAAHSVETELKIDRVARDCAVPAKRAVQDKSEEIERQLEARMRAALEKTSSDLHVLVGHQTNATMAIGAELSVTQSLLQELTTRVQALEIRDQLDSGGATSRHPIGVSSQLSQSTAQPLAPLGQESCVWEEPVDNRTSVNADHITRTAPPARSRSPSSAPHHPPTTMSEPQVSNEDLRVALDNAVDTAVSKFQLAIERHIQRGEQTLQLSERRLHARMRELAAGRHGIDRPSTNRRPARSSLLTRTIAREQRLVEQRAELAARLHERSFVGPIRTDDL